jgi:hypothetical protein
MMVTTDQQITQRTMIITFTELPGERFRRTVLVDPIGTIYLCYDATDSDKDYVLLRAGECDVATANYDEHPFFPVQWLVNQFPESREN